MTDIKKGTTPKSVENNQQTGNNSPVSGTTANTPSSEESKTPVVKPIDMPTEEITVDVIKGMQSGTYEEFRAFKIAKGMDLVKKGHTIVMALKQVQGYFDNLAKIEAEKKAQEEKAANDAIEAEEKAAIETAIKERALWELAQFVNSEDKKFQFNFRIDNPNAGAKVVLWNKQENNFVEETESKQLYKSLNGVPFLAMLGKVIISAYASNYGKKEAEVEAAIKEAVTATILRGANTFAELTAMLTKEAEAAKKAEADKEPSKNESQTKVA